jgi:hypothetical protein
MVRENRTTTVIDIIETTVVEKKKPTAINETTLIIEQIFIDEPLKRSN